MSVWIIQFRPELLTLAEQRLKFETRRTNVERWRQIKQGDILKAKTSRTGKVVSQFVATEDAKVERLQDISVQGALREGVVCPSCGYNIYDAGFNMDHGICVNRWLQQSKARDVGDHPVVQAFAELWDAINNEKGKRYADNPKVAVVSFEPQEPS